MAFQLSRDGEAGPSVPPPRRPSTHSVSSPSEQAQIEATLSARRRRNSVRDFLTGSRSRARSAQRKEAERRGSIISTATGETDIDPDHMTDDEAERLDEEMLTPPKLREAIRLDKAGEPFAVEDDDDEGQGVSEEKQEYVWDVMFENQRGIYIFGKAYFSGRTLLPSDPSAFTLPSRPLPGASSFFVSSPEHPQIKGIQRKARHPFRPHPHQSHDEEGRSLPTERSIRTAYNLSTFQTPSPKWTWLTPWLINMRPGTDEAGWRYNAWFKNAGWKSHAGGLGWNGWVRRREWIRLRCLRPKEDKLESAGEKRGAATEEHNDLGDVLTEAPEEKRKNVEAVLKALGHVSLDRRKMEIWTGWLKKEDDDARAKLQAILEDADTLQALSRCFVQSSTLTAFRRLLESHDFSIAHSSRFPSRSSTPALDEEETKQIAARTSTIAASPKPDTGD